MKGLTGDDVREGLTAIIAVKIPEPQFEGQTKTKLGNTEVKGQVEALVNTHLAEYLARAPARGQGHHRQVHRRGPGPRGGAQGPRPDPPQVAPWIRPRCRASWPTAPAAIPTECEIYLVEGDSRRRLGQAGPRPALPGHPAAEGQDPQRGEGPPGQDAGQRRDPDHHHRPGHRRRRGHLRHREAALPQGHHHDRRRRGRQPHPHADPDAVLPPLPRDHRAGPHVHRRAARCTG